MTPPCCKKCPHLTRSGRCLSHDKLCSKWREWFHEEWTDIRRAAIAIKNHEEIPKAEPKTPPKAEPTPTPQEEPKPTNVCRIYHLILKGTHDERVLKSLQKKEKGQAAALEALRLEIVKK